MKTYTRSNGEVIPIKEMADIHLLHAIKLLKVRLEIAEQLRDPVYWKKVDEMNEMYNNLMYEYHERTKNLKVSDVSAGS